MCGGVVSPVAVVPLWQPEQLVSVAAWVNTPPCQVVKVDAALAWQVMRAGIEGRLSVLMRGRGMKRCRAEAAERFALFVAAAVLANNLMIIGELLTKRSRRRRKTNRQFFS
jgi:hypothetical protein